MGRPQREKRQKVSMKRKKQKVPNKDVYDRVNGITHLPSVDMSCIFQNTIIYFLSSIFILIQRFSTCYLSIPSESKESILTQVRNNSLHKLAYGHSLYIVLLNCPYYFMHLVICKLCLLSYIHEVHIIKTLCYEYLLFLF